MIPALAYTKQLEVLFILLANGEEVWFWECQREAHPHQVATFFAQADLERRIASYSTRVDVLDIATDKKIVERGYQLDCIETLCRVRLANRHSL